MTRVVWFVVRKEFWSSTDYACNLPVNNFVDNLCISRRAA